MGVTIEKTRPGTDLHMGALLRDALDARGVEYRVSSGYLVATSPTGGPSVWITAHNCNGGMHYDTPRSHSLGVTAVVDDGDRTSLVYDGIGDTFRRPCPDAVACADAVGMYLGVLSAPLPVADPFA